MVWRNPFQSKNSEHQIREDEFLSLFDCTVLQMIEEQNLSKVSFVSSTPGAGKTSLFSAFLPRILSKIVVSEHHEEYKAIVTQMERLGVIRAGKVILLSGILSCARNYSIIDEMFQNGRRKQIFFALLNYRIAITFLRSIGQLLDLEMDEYDRITFRDLPSEILSEESQFINGKKVYEWACEGERLLCQYLDSERSETLEVSFVHTTLLIIKLFEANNILVDGMKYFDNTLMIFDDFHKLSDDQKKYISEAVYTLKSNTGVWFGQRLEGLQSAQLVSMDGSLSRDYNPNIVIDNYWPEKSKVFYNMIENIADRRVKEAGIGSYLKFSDCIDEKLNENDYCKALEQFCVQTRERIFGFENTKCKYQYIIEYINSIKSKKQCAIWYECINIKENRENSGQMSIYLGEQEEVEVFKKFVDDNEKVAWYYICNKCKIPFYYGLNNLKILSSYNVEQFLVFAGEMFDCCRIKSLASSSIVRKQCLTPEEQSEIIKRTIKNQWDDMDFRYSHISSIKRFLNNIAAFCVKSRDAERNSYAGGAYTGLAFKTEELREIVSNPKYTQLVEILGACLASKYLERRDGDKGERVIFYLNRWLCVHYQLPLAYGGWKKCGIDDALKMCREDKMTNLEGQMDFDI